MTTQAPALILGAGVAGLAAARALRRLGKEVRVFEAGPRIAGMAESRTDADGFSYDLGAHFITNRLAAAVGVAAECSTVRRYGESVRLADGSEPSYPVGLLKVRRFVGSALTTRLRQPAGAPRSFEDRMIRDYGEQLTREVGAPIAQAWSGVPASQLSAAAADKIPSSLAQTLWLRSMQRMTGRAVAIGYCGEQRQTSSVYHVYPRGGVARICQKMAEDLPAGSLQLESPAQAIHVDGGRVVGATIGGRRIDASAVISTLPLNRLPQLVQGSTAIEPFRRFRYRGIVFVNLKMRGRGLLSNVVVWTPSGYPFYRVTEAPLSMEQLAPEGKTMLLCDIGADAGDATWSTDDDTLIERCLTALESIVPDARSRHLGGRVIRQAMSYPVYSLEYEQERARFEKDGTGIDGLISIGRNGEFGHLLMEDLYWRTQRRMNDLVHGEPAH